MKIVIFLAAVVVALTGCTSRDYDAMPVYLLLGQSNMVGMRSMTADLPAELQKTQHHALFFKDGKWVELAPGVSEPKGFGPEISFSDEMAKSGETIGLIKISAGATTLFSEWNPKSKDLLYTKTINAVDAARKTRPIKIAGILWMQGESDGATLEMAEAYSRNLKLMISSFRADLQSAEIPVAVCRVTAPTNQFPHIDMVRKAQQLETAEHYKWFDCDSLTKGPDNLHYDTHGQIKLGYKFAEAIKSIR